eukprot:CAMPEP_0170805442 /NCGR_PEP_ID=MMETSP0733-20121128/31376_1 /TAXON_ID=186038 /ORGANISM="Fragilariopsis kerguelensis, Strain L26-C5" /LENGTH=75 /DNA_ID=CAMNT_0011159831 /DNA_START=281 /DNA_END=508 /DNA_ORIENTATION=-
MDGSGSMPIGAYTSSSGKDVAYKIVLVVSEDVGEEGTVDSSDLDDDDNDAEDATVCDTTILDGPVNFCCVNASTT